MDEKYVYLFIIEVSFICWVKEKRCLLTDLKMISLLFSEIDWKTFLLKKENMILILITQTIFENFN